MEKSISNLVISTSPKEIPQYHLEIHSISGDFYLELRRKEIDRIRQYISNQEKLSTCIKPHKE